MKHLPRQPGGIRGHPGVSGSIREYPGVSGGIRGHPGVSSSNRTSFVHIAQYTRAM